ncbi:MAG: hypothetical protein Q4B70_04605 [Lachnospiraceae bacterium]|nr:hypothetical protein [Lachnospiraceae bacterium]
MMRFDKKERDVLYAYADPDYENTRKRLNMLAALSVSQETKRFIMRINGKLAEAEEQGNYLDIILANPLEHFIDDLNEQDDAWMEYAIQNGVYDKYFERGREENPYE